MSGAVVRAVTRLDGGTLDGMGFLWELFLHNTVEKRAL